MSSVLDMVDSGGWIDTRDCAKLVRMKLKAEFPGTKFSVRIDRYSGGSSVDVSWTDGPTEEQVRGHVDVYGGRGFDGMIDMSYSYEAWLMPDGSAKLAHTSGTQGSMGYVPEQFGSPEHPDAKLVHFGASYVCLSRRISEEAEAKIRAEITAATGVEWGENAHSVRVPWTTFVDDDGEVKFAHDEHRGEWLSSLSHQISCRRDLS